MYDFCFPDAFVFGTANSAFQSEGAWNRDGKTTSMMDHYAREFAGKWNTAPNSKRTKPLTTDLPDDGCFFYDNFEAYIEDMKKTGQDAYRLSISWPRILPNGVGTVNPDGINFYNRVIDKLLSCGITPFVDLCHWDMPQCLQEMDGFCNPMFPQWFEAYAKICFAAFGDRVKLWSTFNEPEIMIINGYSGKFPPFENNLEKAHLAGQHLLLAHYRAVRLYKSMDLGGKIGAVNCIVAVYPARLEQEDIGAARRQAERRFDWWTEPMLKGRYPQKLLEECPRLLDAMPEGFQRELAENFVPMDFLGLNYYVVNRSQYDPDALLLSTNVGSFYSEPGVSFPPYPPGLLDALCYVKEKYGDVPVYITENGCCHNDGRDEEAECQDDDRIAYLREHLRMLSRAIKLGMNVKGYFYWNDADSYEQLSGYEFRFGLTWVDRKTGRRRWKKSRYYYSQVCKARRVD